jgi:hypothetical protein
LAKEADGCDGFEGARDDLPRAETVGSVSEAVLKQFGVRQNDAELVVQLVKQTGKIHWRGGDRLRNISRDHQAPLERGSSVQTASSARGSRHRVSAKILTEPPAVLTYCTLPPDIQL